MSKKFTRTLRLKYHYWANYTCCAAMLYSKERWQTCRTVDGNVYRDLVKEYVA